MNTSALNTIPNESARVTVDTFKSLLAVKGLQYHVSWKWAGQSRVGILVVTKGIEAIDKEAYSRNSMRWSDGDKTLDRIHTGAPKHQAVQALLTRLS